MDALIEELASGYGRRDATVSLIRRGGDGNRTFRVESGGETLIARLYGEQGQHCPEWVRYEVELLRHLGAAGTSVAAPLLRRDGSAFGRVEGAPCVLFTYADGGVEWPMPSGNAHRLGAAVATLHIAAETLVTDAAPRVFDTERLFYRPLERMARFLSEDSTKEILRATAARAAEWIEAIPATSQTFGAIHGDIHQGNCHFTAEGALTFFDFSNAGIGWRAYDLAGFLWPMRDSTIQDATMQAACSGFLEGYRSIRPLLPEEELALPAFIKARDYWETGSWLEYDKDVDPKVVSQGLRDLATRFERFPLP